jgi:hypothetical protein
MQNSEFEKQVQNKMEQLLLQPNDALWSRVEAQLPKEKKPRRWLILLIFCTVLIGSGIIMYNLYNSSNKNELVAKQVTIDSGNALSKNIDSAIKGQDKKVTEIAQRTTTTEPATPTVLNTLQPYMKRKETAKLKTKITDGSVVTQTKNSSQIDITPDKASNNSDVFLQQPNQRGK